MTVIGALSAFQAAREVLINSLPTSKSNPSGSVIPDAYTGPKQIEEFGMCFSKPPGAKDGSRV